MDKLLNRSIRFEKFLQDRFGVTHERDGKYISSAIKKIPSGSNSCEIAKKDMYVYFPSRFENARLAFVHDNYEVVGYLGVVCDGKYGVISIPCLLTMNPVSVQTVKIEDEDYTEFYFEAGSTLIETTRIAKDSTLIYPIYNELIAKPNIPVYFSYKDALMCLRKAGKYGGLSLEKTNIALEIIVAVITRDFADQNVLFRKAIFDNPQAVPVFNGLRDIRGGVTNLPTAIMGSYSDVGVDSLLVNPPKKLEKYEELLRI